MRATRSEHECRGAAKRASWWHGKAKMGFSAFTLSPVFPNLLFLHLLILLQFGCSKFDLDSKRNAIDCIKIARWHCSARLIHADATLQTRIQHTFDFPYRRHEKIGFRAAKAFSVTIHKHIFRNRKIEIFFCSVRLAERHSVMRCRGYNHRKVWAAYTALFERRE